MTEHAHMGDSDTAVPAFPTQAVRCPRCDVEHSPGYPHATIADCNAALVGTRLMDLTAERDRLRAQVDGLTRHRDGCVANLEAIRTEIEMHRLVGGGTNLAGNLLAILDRNPTP